MKSFPIQFLLTGLILLPISFSQGNLIGSTSTWSRKISQSLQTELAKNPTAHIIVSTNVGTSSVIKKFNSETPGITRHVRIENLVSTLENHAEESQKAIIDLLTKSKKSSTTVESLWISNQVIVMKADSELVTSLAQLDDVGRIDLNEIIKLEKSTRREVGVSADIAWGVETVGAPEVWKTTAGEGIIVGSIDSGVRLTHEALKDNYMGQYGWYDAYLQTSLPNDQDGHGTHTMGTIVGRFGIGVAPNATWLACKGCDTNGCLQSTLLRCGQYIACPHLASGYDKNCSKAPHVVSNSWGGGQRDDFFDDVIAAWHIAEIIPVFAIGNAGRMCRTANSPGDRPNVISVGATHKLDYLAAFSSRGPALDGSMKPEISAPGVDIKSAGHQSDSTYVLMQGTSMACPHVAGVIALIKSAYPDLTYENVKSDIFRGANTTLGSSADTCGDTPDTRFPNNFYGHGRIDAAKTMSLKSSANILQFTTAFAGSLLLLSGMSFM